METEIYKNIRGYEGLYQVSNWGNVKSLKFGKEKLLKPRKNKGGYLQVVLCKNRKKKHFSVHRLVASVFLDNPENLPCVNHKDENKTNNRVENLEWCSHEYNNNYGSHNEKVAKARSKKVLQFSKSGSFIREWESIHECGRNGFDKGNVCLCCRGERKTHKGFIWKYKTSNSRKNITMKYEKRN